MTDLDLAWAAGYLDGEGCIYVKPPSGKNRWPWLSVSASSTDIRPLLKLVKMFGGRLYSRPERGSWREAWWWTLKGSAAMPMLRDLEPFFTIKREQAQLALEYEVAPQDRRIEIGTELKLLKRVANL